MSAIALALFVVFVGPRIRLAQLGAIPGPPGRPGFRVGNQLFSAMILFSISAALVTPNPLAVAGVLLLVATIELGVRYVEEHSLPAVHGDSHRHCPATVGRFVLHLGTSGSAA